MPNSLEIVKSLNKVWEARKDFPILERYVNKKPLVYLDSAASSQKPKSVIEAIERYYTNEHSNVHRGVHYLSQEATTAYEVVREKVQRFINARYNYEVLFTKGTTDSINLVAASFGRANLGAGDEVIVSGMEHHSDIVPWQMVCEEKGAALKVIPMTDEGELDMAAYAELLNEKTKIVAVVHISNSLGTINPIKEIINLAHKKNIPVLVDGAQAIHHTKVDVQELDVDFYAFSGHKMYGPTGIGVLYGKEELLNAMPPYQGGGDMIKNVTFEKTTYNDLPHKFEAGTPNIAGVMGLGAAVDYIDDLGVEAMADWEEELVAYAMDKLSQIEGMRFIGRAKHRASVVSFLIEGLHPYDIGVILDKMGIAVRTGHHCTQPVMDKFGIPGTVRASFAFYNTREDVDRLIEGVNKAIDMLK